jgi:hypothetical protein
MKYILIIWVCSFLGGTSNCFPPVEFPTMYDSWYECSRDAHTQSKRMLASLGFKQVNDARMGTKYNCMQVRTY